MSPLDVRLDVPLPPEILEIARQRKAELVDPVTKRIDVEAVRKLVGSIPAKLRDEIYRDWMELQRRRLEERCRYYEPLSKEKDGSPQLEFHCCEDKIILLSGGNQCIGGETEIYDPVQKKSLRVDQIRGRFNVFTWTGQEVAIGTALKPFQKGVDDLYCVTLETGDSFVASLSHRVLTPDGFLPLSRCHVGSYVFHPQTNLGCDQLVHVGDDRSFWQTVEDSRSSCSAYSRQCDESLRLVRDSDQDSLPLRDDARERRDCAYDDMGALDNKVRYSRLCQLFSHLSIRDDFLPVADRCAGTELSSFCRPYGSTRSLLPIEHQSNVEFCPPRSNFEFVQPGKSSFSLQSSCVLIISIVYVRTDVKWDFTVLETNNYITGGCIHANSGKTEAAMQEANWVALGTHPYKKTWDPPCYIRVNSVSWKEGVGKIIIPKLKEIVRREDLKGGSWDTAFSTNLNAVEGGLQLNYKNGSFIECMTYEQDASKHGGTQRHLIICDEEPPESIYEESLQRLSRYNGRMIISMTPMNGITWTYDKLYEVDDSVVKKFYLPKLANKHLPQESRDFDEQRLRDDPEEAAIRLYGIPMERGGAVLKAFRDEHHVCDDFPVPLSWPKAMLIDPAPAKSHAMTLMAIDPRTTHGPSGQSKVYFYGELLFKEGGSISDFCNEAREVMGDSFVTFFRIDPHWDWENKATRTDGKSGFNIYAEFKKHIPRLQSGLANIESPKGGWIYYEAMKERLTVDLMTREMDAKVGVQWFRHGCRETIKQIRTLSYIASRQRFQTSDKPRIRHKNDDLVDCCGMGLVDKTITNMSMQSGGFRVLEPNYKRDITGRIM